MGSIRFGFISGLFGSSSIRVRVILFYFEYRHHCSQINVGSDQFGWGLFGFESDSDDLISGLVRVSFSRSMGMGGLN